MKIEHRNVQVRNCRVGKLPMPPSKLVGQRLVMTQIDGPQRLCVVRPAGLEYSIDHDLGPFDADAFEVAYPEGK